VYVQIADAIAARIASGELAPGRPIPSETSLRQEFGVASETVRYVTATIHDHAGSTWIDSWRLLIQRSQVRILPGARPP
jgi:DNA-binding transcriptional MocR family regulator